MDSPSLRLSEPNRRLEPTSANRFNVSGVYANNDRLLVLTQNLGDGVQEQIFPNRERVREKGTTRKRISNLQYKKHQ